MLRACAQHECRIMFPMISSLDEFIEARTIVHACIEELNREGQASNQAPILGAMVEIPAAVEILDELCRETGFLCIGTNDLVQYILAVDRTNERVASFYKAHHPAVLRALYRITETANRYGRDVSICGDVVLDLRMLPFLVGIGLRKVSVDPRYIGKVQKALNNLDLAQAEEHAKHLLGLGLIDEINKELEKVSIAD